MTPRVIRTCLTWCAACAAIALAAAPAQAQNCNPSTTVPPGNSEIDQYVESIPGACGNEKPSNGGGSSGGSGGSGASGGSGGSSGSGGGAVPAATAAELASLGEDGLAAAALAEATSPSESGGGEDGSSGVSGASGSDGGAAGAKGSNAQTSVDPESLEAAASGGGSVLGALADTLTGGSGEGGGAVLPVTLLAVLVGGLGFYFLRRRDLG
jgi:hypothetical protein